MKILKKLVIMIFIFSFMLIIIPISVSAHTSNLGIDGDNDITFDDCDADNYVSSSDIGDGYNEKWYDLMWGNTDTSTTPDTFNYTVMYHIDNDINTVYYQFQDNGYEQPTTTWSTGIGVTSGNDVKTKFENSMLKWNNVFYYKLNSEGFYEKHKIVNLVDYDSLEDNSGITPHVLIYPYFSTGDFVAETSWNYSTEVTSDTQTSNGIKHKHFTQFRMQANTYFLSTSTYLQDRTGAHEFGHVLGLFDIDTTENPNQSSLYHHEEILMGYSKNGYYSRQTEITYKDIAGVAITRGFHTNSDHLWLYDEDNPKDGKYKLICSLCNCVKYVDDLSSYNYYEYEQCGHNESSLPNTVDDNMIPVASYGNTDYYKCKYCRYVAPFTSRITQNYVYCGEHNDSKHILENIGGNLNYRISENHSMIINLGDNNYKCSGCDYRTINTFEEYSLSNYSATINKTVNLSGNETKYYKINSNYNKYYEFIVDGTYGVDIKLFDENFNEILVDDLNDSNSIEHIINQLQVGTYYLEIKNSSSSTNSTSIKIVSRTTAYIGVGDNDVLLNTHNYNEGIYTSNYYYYINNRGVGFYRFTLTGVKADGTTVTYPYNSIMIKDHMNEDIIDKYSLTGYSNQAISGYNENTFAAYLNATGYFYVYIDIDTEGLKSLTLNIEPVESETIDLFTKSESTNSTMEILDSETTKGDYAKKIILKQAGEFTVNYSYSGSQSNDILFVLGKLNYNSTTQKYTIETLISQLMDAENDSFTYTLDLTDGTYFVAYFNKDDNAAFDVTFNRLVTQYGGSVLIPDPDSMTDGGSQVEVYEKGLPYYEVSYRGTNIVIGFTRVIYIDYHYVDQHSREDYYWYSSNDSIATVSQHGTVFGKSAGTVKIMAVNKDDPSIVFVKQFTVVQDTKTYSEVVYSEFNDTHKLSNGEYQLGLDVQNSPYPMTQYYSWRVVSKSSTITSVSIDQWGNVAIVGTGNIVIEGYNYIYNDNYGVRINLTVTN